MKLVSFVLFLLRNTSDFTRLQTNLRHRNCFISSTSDSRMLSLAYYRKPEAAFELIQKQKSLSKDQKAEQQFKLSSDRKR